MSRFSLCLALLLVCATLSRSQSTLSRPFAQPSVRQGVSAPIRSLVRTSGGPPGLTSAARNGIGRPLVKTTDLLNFDGLSVNPQRPLDTPNPNGSVGATQYVQAAGDQFAIYDKNTGALIAGPLAGKTFWVGLNGPCENSPYDEGVIAQYDKLAGRWVMSRTVNKGNSAVDVQCVAVSTTSDATGAYYQYEFDFFANVATLISFTRMTLWPDAYYFWADLEGSGGDEGGWACGLDRLSMLSGAAASSVCFNVDTVQLGDFMPSDLDGMTPPSSGTPNFFVSLDFRTQTLDIYKFHVDFSNPTASTFTGPSSVRVKSWSVACPTLACIAQPSPGVALDSYSLFPMYRFAYRNFNGVDTAVFNHTVDRGDGVAAVRWYELQNLNSTPTLVQQGTFASAGTAHLWNGSIATDKIGDIALGFNLSSSTRRPSVLYTGRIPTDPKGRMEPPKTIISGSGVQTILNVWGSISDLAVDPADDCTFWYTNEYMSASGFDNWGTRIASFKFTGCQ